ncbi:MAG TPA: hypothetical protein DEF34_12890 [Desulfotomaculum sp.]|nr:MAG: hypothetical protein VR67_01875 [Peptococcaceae bacterium BRH_c8a]KJS75815.1 MAG: hypothetical protein JL56_06765 [Desulfotomaculum sp. BICA1-6]HBX24507.1 hypothetical protein [Desulfotomaculum sp.]
MDKVPIVTLIFYSIPESFLILSFGLTIQKKKLSFSPILLATLISVAASYCARLLPLPYGIHTFLGVLTVFLMFLFILRLDPKQSLVSSIVSIGVLVALESVILSYIQFQLGLGLQDVMALSPWQKTIIGWPHLAVWAGLTTYLYHKHKFNQAISQ